MRHSHPARRPVARNGSRHAGSNLATLTLAVIAAVTISVGASEPLGPSSRRTGLVISEIMYHPSPRPDGKNLEFIELYNSEAVPADVSGHSLSGDVDFILPANTTIPARGFLVIAAAPADVQGALGLSGVLGGFGNGTNALPNGRGVIRLRSPADAVLLEVNYSDEPPWPASTDGGGHSLVLTRPTLGQRDPAAWGASLFIGGSPGGLEPADLDPQSQVVINEFLAHTDEPAVDFVELHNRGVTLVELSGFVLTDDPGTNKFIIPSGLTLLPGGFIHFTETNLNFSLSSAGEMILLKNAAGTRIIDAVRFDGQENGVATGRFPDGADSFYRLTSPTPGTPNEAILTSEVVINEIMYNPISEEGADEFVELFNRGPSVVNLSGWRLRGGIDFTFPTNTVLPSDGYLVVAADATRLLINHPNLTTNQVAGDFRGELSNRGERLALAMPDLIVVTNSSGQVETNLIHIDVDEVTYGTGGRWGRWSDGGGSSLELIDARANHRLASNWADSDETTKAPWTDLEVTGILDNGNTGYPMNNLQVILLDAGECLLDNVEVIGIGGTNRVANWNFESGIQGWFGQGTHELIRFEPTGYGGSSGSLNIRATADGDTGANRVRTAVSPSLGVNQIATIRAKARWWRGRPEILLRLHGNQLELAGRMTLPPNLGTPGTGNSRALTNAPPAIHSVSHSPVLPATNQSVFVTARVHDPDRVGSVLLNYRVDPATNLQSLAMLDNGIGGDRIAGDGVFTGEIPAQTNGALVAFHLQAVDNHAGATAGLTYPSDAPARECLVRFGEPVATGAFGVYRLWMTQATFNKWRNRVRLSNDPLDVTFAYGDSRIVYNVGALYSGSPFHSPNYSSPTGSPCDYKLVFPEDDRWLGEEEVLLSWPGNGGDDPTGQREPVAYWVAGRMGLPFNHRRPVLLYVNGVRRGNIMDDTQRASPEVIEQWYPDESDGELFKIAGWFEFDDPASAFQVIWATLQNFTTTNLATGQRVQDAGRYRWNWQKRNPRNATNDFATLFSLVDAANTTGPAYVNQMERIVDVEQWMRTFAVEHLVGNWDSYGNRNGQNMFAYKPRNGLWKLLIWDLDIALGGISDGPTTSLFQVSDTVIGRVYTTPAFRRIYWRAMIDAVNGPLHSTNANPLIDARHAAFLANGISASSPATIKSYIASRRASVLAQLAPLNAPFAITGNSGAAFDTASNLVTLSGTAPIPVVSIQIDGIPYTPIWTSVTNWTINLPVHDGLNTLILQALDRSGNPINLPTTRIDITYFGSGDLPGEHLVINEIMYNPLIPGAGFVEIHNTSPNTTFDLSGLRLDGADFTFPGGSYVAPKGFVVVANDIEAFGAAYGRFIPVTGVFDGRLDNAGETLRLVMPGQAATADLVLDEVTYGTSPPWPLLADGWGPSLQLIDAPQDNERVANWAAVDPTVSPATALATPGAPNSVASILAAWPDLWLNEILPANTTGLADRFGDRDPWVELYNADTNVLDLGGFHFTDTYTNLTRWSFPPGSSIGPHQFLVVWLDAEPGESSATEPHTNFRIDAESGTLALTRGSVAQSAVMDHLFYAAAEPNRSLGFYPDGGSGLWQSLHYPTPGGTNDPSPGPFTIFINEWMAGNTNRLADPADGEFDDWFELFNPNNTTVDLTGFALTDDPTNSVRWTIPAATLIPAHGHVLIWADRDTHQNSPTNADLHADFRLDKDGDLIALFAPDGRLVDAVAFGEQIDDVSQGRWPDGSSGPFHFMPDATPRAANRVITNPPPAIQIVQTIATAQNHFALTWTAVPGGVYRVHFKPGVDAANWTELPGDVFAYSTMASKADATPIGPVARFYRVLRVK